MAGDIPWGSDTEDVTLLKKISLHSYGSLAAPESLSPTLTELLEVRARP